MDLLLILLAMFGMLVFLPILAYLIVKFGAAAYFHEKQKQTKQTKN